MLFFCVKPLHPSVYMLNTCNMQSLMLYRTKVQEVCNLFLCVFKQYSDCRNEITCNNDKTVCNCFDWNQSDKTSVQFKRQKSKRFDYNNNIFVYSIQRIIPFNEPAYFCIAYYGKSFMEQPKAQKCCNLLNLLQTFLDILTLHVSFSLKEKKSYFIRHNTHYNLLFTANKFRFWWFISALVWLISSCDCYVSCILLGNTGKTVCR